MVGRQHQERKLELQVDGTTEACGYLWKFVCNVGQLMRQGLRCHTEAVKNCSRDLNQGPASLGDVSWHEVKMILEGTAIIWRIAVLIGKDGGSFLIYVKAGINIECKVLLDLAATAEDTCQVKPPAFTSMT